MTKETVTTAPEVAAPVDTGMVSVTVTKSGADRIATGEAGDGYELNRYYPNKAKIMLPLELAAQYEDCGWVVSD